MTQSEFIKELARLVQKYAPQYGIKVCSPIIAQGILESASGTSNKVYITKEDGSVEWRHNYFGLKWRNNRCAITNEYFEERTSEQNPDGSRYDKVDKFFKFNSLEECVIGYFQWTNTANYANLKGVTDPYQYLVNIKADKYATSIKYVENVYAVIQKYNLTQYDVTKKEEEAMGRKPIVCIDAGHFKKNNRCPNIPEYYESEVMWKLHLLQKKYLEQLGVDVITTRADLNTDLALHLRGMKSKDCDLFISDHSNAVGSGMNETVDYIAIFHLFNDVTSNADEISKEIAEKLGPVIQEIMCTKQGYKVLSKQYNGDRNGDGVMNDNYYGVLHGAHLVHTPGLIIEHGFHTHSNTVRWLLDDNNLDRLARAEAECIASYLLKKNATLGDTPTPVTPTPSTSITTPTENTATNTIATTATKTLYRVQVGAYSIKSNAENQLKAIKAKGFDAILVKSGLFISTWYKLL